MGKPLRARARDMVRAGQHAIAQRAERAVGGPARAWVVALLASALGLSGADFATVSATAGDLTRAFDIGNVEIGLLVSVSSLVAAAATIPVGVLTDRVNRTRLLTISVAFWAAAMLLAATAQSYLWLLLSRAALGAVTATAGPTIASLTGDFFPAAERGRILGFVLGGELVGTGLGFLVSGELAALVGWRVAFGWLAIPAVVLAWQLTRLPEPARGGQSTLSVGQVHIPQEAEVGDGEAVRDTGGGPAPGSPGGRPDIAGRAARHAGARPNENLVLHADPAGRSTWWALRYVLRVRTNVLLIIASALGYFYFAGLRTFVILFATAHYGLAESVVSVLILVIGVGALAGVYLGGRVSDRQVERGRLNARVLIPAGCLLAVVAVFVPTVLTTSIALALPLLTVGAALLGAVNPPVDAARLDIIPPPLWGRAEAVRTVLRTLGEAAAPTLFGLVSAQVFGGPDALAYTFLAFLVALLAAALLAMFAPRTYPGDVATASASRRAIVGP